MIVDRPSCLHATAASKSLHPWLQIALHWLLMHISIRPASTVVWDPFLSLIAPSSQVGVARIERNYNIMDTFPTFLVFKVRCHSSNLLIQMTPASMA